jgi:tetratricopeptide (TPR) repeat protein
LLPQLPLTPERLGRELRLQLDLGLSLGTLKGFAASETRDLYVRANELAEQVGDDEQRQMVISGLFSHYIWRAELQPALVLAEQGIPLAERISDRSWLGEAYGRLGVVLYFLGQWQASRSKLEQAIAAIGDLHRPPRVRFGAAAQSSMVLHRRFLANTLWYLGYPDQALAHMQEALARAKALAHPYTLATALDGFARFRSLRREVQETRTLAEAAIAFAQPYGFRNVLVSCQMLLGWVLVQQEQVEAGIAQISGAMAFSTANRHQLGQAEHLAALADAYGRASKPEQGLQLLDQALAHVEATGKGRSEVELHRLKGELLHMRGEDSQVVESHLLRALMVARQQEAKMLELRTAMSLGRLWQAQGRAAEARELLAGIYAWFSEGFDTPDLQDAQSLLAELA